MRTRILLAAGLLGLGLTLSGCGGGGAGGEQPGAPASTDSQEAQAVKYSQCMRDNGVPSFPDPVNGRLQLQVRKGSDLDPDSEVFKKAQETCKPLAPAGLGQQGQNGEQQAQMLKYTRCMRENGVPNMPDPQADGRMLIGGPDTGVDPESQAFKDAQTKCRDQLPGGVN
jgi:hypothetical protein